jgi:PilZ domain
MEIYVYKHKGRPPNNLKDPPITWENREFQRIQCQLEVSIKELHSQKEIRGESADISRGGIRINMGKKLYIGEKLELWVHLKDSLKPIHRFGKVSWLKEIDPSLYICGISFESSLLHYTNLNY